MSVDAIFTGGASDPGGRDDVSATVAGSVAAATARYGEHQADTYGQSSQIGDLMPLPETNEHSKHQGGDDEGYPS